MITMSKKIKEIAEAVDGFQQVVVKLVEYTVTTYEAAKAANQTPSKGLSEVESKVLSDFIDQTKVKSPSESLSESDLVLSPVCIPTKAKYEVSTNAESSRIDYSETQIPDFIPTSPTL